MSATLPDLFPPRAVRIPTRPEVRALVDANRRERDAAVQRGQKPLSVELDQHDDAQDYALLLDAAHGPEVATAFLALYQEEVRGR